MPKRMRLNDKAVRKPLPVKGRDYQIFDVEVRGFAVCIYRSGRRAFTLDYRYAGRQRRMTIGRWPEWTVTAARDRARQLRREIDEGGDPLAGKGELRTAPRISDMIERYTSEHVVKLAPANAADQKAMLAKLVVPQWGSKLVTDITKNDVAKLLAKIAEGRARPSKVKPNNRARKLQGLTPTPVRANRVGEVLRKMSPLLAAGSEDCGFAGCAHSRSAPYFRVVAGQRWRVVGNDWQAAGSYANADDPALCTSDGLASTGGC